SPRDATRWAGDEVFCRAAAPTAGVAAAGWLAPSPGVSAAGPSAPTGSRTAEVPPAVALLDLPLLDITGIELLVMLSYSHAHAQDDGFFLDTRGARVSPGECLR